MSVISKKIPLFGVSGKMPNWCHIPSAAVSAPKLIHPLDDEDILNIEVDVHRLSKSFLL